MSAGKPAAETEALQLQDMPEEKISAVTEYQHQQPEDSEATAAKRTAAEDSSLSRKNSVNGGSGPQFASANDPVEASADTEAADSGAAVMEAATSAAGATHTIQHVTVPATSQSNSAAAAAVHAQAVPTASGLADAAADAGVAIEAAVATVGSSTGPEAPLPAGTASTVGDPLHQFEFTLDVRSFQGGRRLPVALASVYVKAFLPQQLLDFLTGTCGAKVPRQLCPLLTRPAVDIARGSKGPLPNGCASVEFGTGVMSLARLLAQGPNITLEVWHKDKVRSDLLLGVAHVSLSVLLQESWVETLEPVYAIMASARGGSGTRLAQQEEQVEVGLLRLILGLQDKGPDPAVIAVAPLHQQHRRRQPSSTQVTAGNSSAAAISQATQQQPQPVIPDLAITAAMQEQQQQVQQQVQQQGTAVAAASAAEDPTDLQLKQLLPDYILCTMELEAWKKAEEAAFKAQLKELEQQRLAVIEALWLQHESEHSAMKAEFTRLQQAAQKVLDSAQAREAALVSAEADLRRRQADLEHQQAARVAEAQAAVRRLQVECEHQLAVEKDRTAAVAAQRDEAQARRLAAEAQAAAIEAQFAEYRAAHRNTSEAQLQAALEQATRSARHYQEKSAKTLKAKQCYKQQVLQLARELAAVQQQRQAEEIQQLTRQQAAAAAEQQSRLASVAAAELPALRQVLQELRDAALPPNTAATAAATGHRTRQQHDAGHGEAMSAVVAAMRSTGTQSNAPLHAADMDLNTVDTVEMLCAGKKDQQQQQLLPQDAKPSRTWGERQRRWHGLPQRQRRQRQQCSMSSSEFEDEDVSGHEWGAEAAASDDGSSNSGSDFEQLQQALPADCSHGISMEPSQGSWPAAAAAADSVGAAAASAEQVPLKAIGGSDQRRSEATTAEATVAAGDSPGSAAAADGGCSSLASPLSEVRRLLKEKVELLSSGLYSTDDAVIQQIDARVLQLADQQC